MSGIQGINNTSFFMNMQNINNKNGQDPFLTDAAKTLGISYDELKSQLDSGTDLNTIVTNQGLTVDDFQQQMITLFNSHQSANANQTGAYVDSTT